MLRERFAPFGEIVNIEIVREPTTKQSRYLYIVPGYEHDLL